MVRISYCAVILACLVFISSSCTVNLTDRRLDDLGERMTKVEGALPQLIGIINNQGQLLNQQQEAMSKKADKPVEKKEEPKK